MRIFLLLIFSLLAGCEDPPAVKACTGGWADFTCNHTEKWKNPIITSPHGNIKTKTQEGRERDGRTLHYNDEKNGHFTLFIEDLKQKDTGEYACKYGRQNLHAVKLQTDGDCQKLQQTAYLSTKTNITCDVTEDNKSTVKFLCKMKGSICEDISSTGSKGRFRYTDTKSGFNVTISDVSLGDDADYWCGLRSVNRALRSALRKITLEVQKIGFFTRSPTAGQNFTYWCDYKRHTADKFICKGEDPSACVQVGSTAQNNNNGKFFLSDDKEKGKITITVTRVTVQDTGTYWCGAEASDPEHSNVLFHRFNMTVAEVPTTSPVPSPQAPTASASNSHGGVLVITTALICVVVLLLFVLLLIYIYKRFSHSNTTRNGAPKTVREDYVYEEIHELRPKPESGNAMNSIYVTANCPTNPSALLHYSTINFHKAGGETPRPSSTGCEYSTVKFTQSPNTVIQPSPSTADALYSTVNKPQQQQRNLIPGRDI